jgi:hypothetical protein
VGPTRINGKGVTVVIKLLTEIGTDVSRFANVRHFGSWLGLRTATQISGCKVLSAGTIRSANRARQALKMAAKSLSGSDSALAAIYRRLSGRMNKPWANTATAQKLANGALPAFPRRTLRRPSSAALRRATAPAQHRRHQAPRRRPGLPTQPDDGGRMSRVFSFAS